MNGQPTGFVNYCRAFNLVVLLQIACYMLSTEYRQGSLNSHNTHLVVMILYQVSKVGLLV